ncbi:hypothetical protein [Kaistella palustris]|uniref:hypothetical protein n=1 Tax=Kaistella palustris TaxID=493376 RepID=UPI00041CEBA1|nr:hypothetical protein [Kaistella palustris]
MDHNSSLIEYIFNNENLDFIVDVENKKITVKDYDEVNQNLFNQTSELKKQIFSMFIKGEDVTLNRIKTKLLQTKELLMEYSNIGFMINVVNKDFEGTIEPEDVRTMNNLKIYYIDEMVSVINNFSFETAEVPVAKASFKSGYTVEELAYFFKLSIEQGIIVLDKNQKTKFFDFIAANFQSKDQQQISPNSIRNKSYDPSPATIEKIREDLLQMLQLTRAHRDSDKIEWKK